MRRGLGILAATVLSIAAVGKAAGQGAPAGFGTLLSTARSTGDSPAACAALVAAERDRWRRHPITAVDVYRGMGDGLAALAMFRLAAFVPNVGVQLRRDASVAGGVVSWSASLPFGPVTACRTAPGGGVDELQSLRVVVEPGLVVRDPVTVFLRAGVRAIWHPSASRLGLGAGLGSTLAWIDTDRTAASISPELVLHVGRCCRPGYLLLSARADRYYPRRAPDALTIGLGVAFW